MRMPKLPALSRGDAKDQGSTRWFIRKHGREKLTLQFLRSCRDELCVVENGMLLNINRELAGSLREQSHIRRLMLTSMMKASLTTCGRRLGSTSSRAGEKRQRIMTSNFFFRSRQRSFAGQIMMNNQHATVACFIHHIINKCRCWIGTSNRCEGTTAHRSRSMARKTWPTRAMMEPI